MTWLVPPAEASTLKTTANAHGPFEQSVVSSKNVSPSFAKMFAWTLPHSSAHPVHSCTRPSLGPSNVPFRLATCGSPEAQVCAGPARPAAVSRAVLASANSSPNTASQPAGAPLSSPPSTNVAGASTRAPLSQDHRPGRSGAVAAVVAAQCERRRPAPGHRPVVVAIVYVRGEGGDRVPRRPGRQGAALPVPPTVNRLPPASRVNEPSAHSISTMRSRPSASIDVARRNRPSPRSRHR